MEKFTRKLAYSPEYIKTFDDAGPAQLGHLNAIISEVNTLSASGVSSISAGTPNVTVTPAGGTGNVTIDVTAGPGGGGVTTVTYTALQALIAGGTLVPGTIYKITGFNKNMPAGGAGNLLGLLPEILYDDGNDLGVTIYMQALSTTELATSGYGEFYNPKYRDGSTYSNTDATGLYGIWDGNNPTTPPTYVLGDVVFWGGYAWENTTGSDSPAVSIMDLDGSNWTKLPYSNATWYELVIDEIKVDWNNGIIVERYNAENQIRVSFNADSFAFSLALNQFLTNLFLPSRSPISATAWGLYSKVTPEGINTGFYGISNLEVINSWVETVNFKGVYMQNNKFSESYYVNNYVGDGCGVAFNTIKGKSYIQNNTLSNTSYLEYNSLENDCYIQGNILSNGYLGKNKLTHTVYIDTNTITDSSIQENIITEGEFANIKGILNNILTNSSTIIYNELFYSVLSGNILLGNSEIKNNTISTSILSGNVLTFGWINSNTLEVSSQLNSNTLSGISFGFGICSIIANYLNSSKINDNELFCILFPGSSTSLNTLQVASEIKLNIFDSSNISTNSLTNVSIIQSNNFSVSSITQTFMNNGVLNVSASGTLTSKDFKQNTIKNATLSGNVTSATHIFSVYPTEIFKNSSGANRLSYFNGSDVLTVVNTNAFWRHN